MYVPTSYVSQLPQPMDSFARQSKYVLHEVLESNKKTALSDVHFWKEFVAGKFDLCGNPQLLEGPLKSWGTNDWVMYFDGWEDDEDCNHPMRPLPSTWNCGVVIPRDLDVTSLDSRHLQGLRKSLELLTRIRQAKNEFGYRCGYGCSTNESGDGHDIAVFLIPWDKDALPDKRTLFCDIFHFHPAIWNEELSHYCQEAQEEPLFHIDTAHRDRSKMCLNSTFGRYDVSKYDKEKEIEFCTWLQKIMDPTKRYRSGYHTKRLLASMAV